MNGVEVIRKQEEYRLKTITLVEELSEQGLSKDEIAEAVGLSNSEVDSIQRIIKRSKVKTAGRPNVRRFF